MKVCLIRHAIAVERGSSGYVDDRARPLTPEGRKRMAEAARGLRQLFTPDAILTSPVLRARQTAVILGKAWEAPVSELPSLGQGDHAGTLNAIQQGKREGVALVGHEPWMRELLSLLLASDANTVAAEFKKGAAALVEGDADAGKGAFRLLWFLPPGALRAMKG